MTALALPAGYRFEAFESLDSTNDEALRRLAAGTARHGDVFLARSQTAGRGRRGRHWQSPRGNLHLTVVVVPPGNASPGQLAFVGALAVGAAVGGLLPASADLRYKWPNDLLLGGRKLAGLLIEGGGNGKERGLAIGIGINLAEAPRDVAFPGTALRDAGLDVAPAALVAPLCMAFGALYESWLAGGFASTRTAWLARAYGIGTRIEARMPDGAIHGGIFRDLAADGALVLEAPGGIRRTIAAGDVFFAAA